MKKIIIFLFLGLLVWTSCKVEEPTPKNPVLRTLRIQSVQINDYNWVSNTELYNISLATKPIVKIVFDDSINVSKFLTSKVTFSGDIGANFTASIGTDNKTLLLTTTVSPKSLTEYTFNFDSGNNLGGTVYNSFSSKFMTQLDTTAKFPAISDDSLLTLVQKRTFDYFWSYAHPTSGLARERLNSGETVTMGGSGFGIMGIPVAIERGFITRQQGLDRMNQIVNFLSLPNTDKFHGAFPHWMNGTTGKVIPFGTQDDGADLVETAFLMEGLLTVQSYFKTGNTAEKAMCANIETLWENVDWSWFQQNSQQKLFWHWSPDYGWAINMQISGWDEALIVYVLAASSPTFPITKAVYDNGWALNGGIKNGKSFYGVSLPLGPDYGGPMFFAHYSFLGLDPRKLSDSYANYWTQNTAHALINYDYCVANPKGYYGYSANCWGLTASDIQNSYTASSPTNDVGVIAPTAALSSFPYTPAQSMQALHFFYYKLGDKIWGTYGFNDSFNLNQGWFANSYLAIDEGPIVVMIENYRTGLLWNLFMQNTYIQAGLTKLGFSY
ncbi:MAG: glucoamylase family protein [Paludibacter sp.]|nr:glucoamylase family protein [Paludibacter sp.]